MCHSKTAWASINKKSPLKDFELPDLFSNNKNRTRNYSTSTPQETTVSTENDDGAQREIMLPNIPTQSPFINQPITTENTLPKPNESSINNELHVNTENLVIISQTDQPEVPKQKEQTSTSSDIELQTDNNDLNVPEMIVTTENIEM